MNKLVFHFSLASASLHHNIGSWGFDMMFRATKPPNVKQQTLGSNTTISTSPKYVGCLLLDRQIRRTWGVESRTVFSVGDFDDMAMFPEPNALLSYFNIF